MLVLGLCYVTGSKQPGTVSRIYVDNGRPAAAPLASAQNSVKLNAPSAVAPAYGITTEALRSSVPSNGSRAVRQMLSRAFETNTVGNTVEPQTSTSIASSIPVSAAFHVPGLPSSAMDVRINAPEAMSTSNVTVVEAQIPEPIVHRVAPRTDAFAMNSIGGEDGNKPIFLHNDVYEAPDKTLLQRFEFSFSESFGRQFPNSAATNNSLPLITNSTIGTFFQVLPKSEALWIGASVGTANITRKNLFTRAGNPIDPLQNVLTSDTVHAQTSYIGAYLQYRVPAFSHADLTFTGGYGFAGLGKMVMGELGMHYAVSREVGLLFGLRGLRFSYDLSKEKADALSSGSGSLVVPKGVEDASPSFYMEISTGLFFHF
jgi:hypothetical protein